MYGVPIYVFGIYKHHRTLLYSWFPTVKSVLTYTQMCRFLSQEVRENRGYFIALPTRDHPRRPREFDAPVSNFYS